MSKKKKKQGKDGASSQKNCYSGLGRSLNELLEDNSELTNMECKVLLNKDGEALKIYNKVGGLSTKGGGLSHNNTRKSVEIRHKVQSYPTIPPQKPDLSESGASGQGEVSRALDSLDDYRQPAKDEFLEAVLDVSSEYRAKEYKTDKDGRIIIDLSNKSKIKVREK